MVCLSRPYPFKFFKGCLPQILRSPLLNTFSHFSLISNLFSRMEFYFFVFDEKLLDRVLILEILKTAKQNYDKIIGLKMQPW